MLLKYAKNYKKQLFLGPFFKFLEAVFELFLPILMAHLVDQGIRKNNQSYTLKMALWMIVLSIIGLGCVMICQYYSSYASQGFGTELRNQMMKKINEFSYTELNTFGTDTLITRITSDINQLQLALAMFIRLVIRAPFLSVGSVVMAFYIDTSAGLVFLAILILFGVILYFFIKKTTPFYAIIQKKLDHLNHKISQNLSGVRVIRAFVKQQTEIEEVSKASDDLATINIRITNISALLTPITTLIVNLAIFVLLYLGALNINIGKLQQGEVVALINYITQMLLALIVVSNLVVIFTKAFASANRVKEVLAINTSKSKFEHSFFKTPSFDEAITFNQVSFRYPLAKEFTLKNLSFSIQPKTVLGITGPTGSGKSTLIQLIPRFFDSSKGQLTIGQTEISQIDLTILRQKIAYVPQKAVLFTGTIRENLRWGNNQATDSDCWQALEIAQCKDFVSSLENDLDTPIYENGKNLSGGQRQRLSIARALMKKPKILILDDSLSALDYQTDLKLRESLQQNLNHTTLVIVSQRISSIRQANQILVLDNGNQLALGTHEKLLKECTEYKEMAKIQGELAHHD